MGDKIRETIKGLAAKSPVQVLVAKVVSVDWNKRNCKVKTEDGREFFKVRLRAVIDNSKKGVCIKPKVDSYVLIGLINNQQMSAYVVSTTEVDAIEIVAANDVLKIDVVNGTFEFNGGQNKGMLKLVKSVERWNKIEDEVNKLKSILNGIMNTQVNEPGNGAPSAFQIAMKSALQSWNSSQLVKTVNSDVENTDVKH